MGAYSDTYNELDGNIVDRARQSHSDSISAELDG